jgi:hypothetical protein
MTTAIEGGEGSASRHGRSLLPGKTRYPLYRRLSGPQGRSRQVRKISPPTGIRSPDRPARSQSLYQLRYPVHKHNLNAEFYQHRVDNIFCIDLLHQLHIIEFNSCIFYVHHCTYVIFLIHGNCSNGNETNQTKDLK